AAVLRSGDLLGLADEQLVERGAPHRVHEREQTGLRDLHAVDHREHELAHRERQRIFHGQLLLLRLRCGFLVHGDSWSRGPLLGRTDSRPDSESPLRLHDFNNARDIPATAMAIRYAETMTHVSKTSAVPEITPCRKANMTLPHCASMYDPTALAVCTGCSFAPLRCQKHASTTPATTAPWR